MSTGEDIIEEMGTLRMVAGPEEQEHELAGKVTMAMKMPGVEVIEATYKKRKATVYKQAGRTWRVLLKMQADLERLQAELSAIRAVEEERLKPKG